MPRLRYEPLSCKTIPATAERMAGATALIENAVFLLAGDVPANDTTVDRSGGAS